MTSSLAHSRRQVRASILSMLLLLAPATWAQEDFFGTIEVDTSSTGSSERDWSLLGWAIEKIGFGYESPPPPFARRDEAVNSLETSLYLQFDQTLGPRTQLRASGKYYHDEVYRLQDDTDTNFSPEEINEFRNRYEVRDLYIEHETQGGLYLKFGKQILAWGMSEYLRVTDIVNTEDLYTFGQQDLEDLRLPVPALLGSVSLAGWTLDGAVTWGAGHDYLAPERDEFDPFIFLRQPGQTIVRQDPEQEHEVFLRASTRWARGDIQIIAGEFNENRLSGRQIESQPDSSTRHYYGQARNRALGLAANRVAGSWLLFGEAALHTHRSVRPAASHFLSSNTGWQQRDQWLGALGLEYSGLRNLLLSLEVDAIHTLDHDATLQAPRNEISAGVRAYWTAMNERLQLLAVWNELADDAGHVARLSLNYDFSDAFTAGLLWVSYDSPSDSIFSPYRHNDTIQAQLRYNFQF
ncbi:MAG: DUF1302 family protein [Pseudohongiellaceae bacterium]